MVQIRQNLVASSKYSLKCPYEMDAQYITIHNTDNDASADAEVRYMIGNSSSTSFHFAVDDKEVVQGIPTNRNAWHCGDSGKGDGNRKSIGIEICYNKSGGTRYYQAEANAVELTAKLLKERGWGIDRVKTHKYWTEIGVKRGLSSYIKNCPSRILNEGRWQGFLNAVQAALNNSSVAVSSPTPTPTQNANPQYASSNTVIGVATVLIDNLNMRNQPSTNGDVLGQIQSGGKYLVYENVNGWFNLGGCQWAYSNNGQYMSFAAQQAQSSPSLAGKRVESKVNGLNFRNKPSWSASDVVGQVNVGEGFIIDEQITVEGSPQYRVHNSKGATFYITASEQYVRVE